MARIPTETPKKPKPAAWQPEMFVLRPIVDDLKFSVLRREFNGLTNSASEFVHKKLHPFQPTRGANDPTGRIWRPTSARSEVLLPAGVSDLLTRPCLLLAEFEAQAVEPKDLVVAVKLTFDDKIPLHESWEQARLFARVVLADKFGLPTILAMHAPFSSAIRNPNSVHVHVMALARKLTADKFRSFSELACDSGQEVLVTAWQDMKTQFRKRA